MFWIRENKVLGSFHTDRFDTKRSVRICFMRDKWTSFISSKADFESVQVKEKQLENLFVYD